MCIVYAPADLYKGVWFVFGKQKCVSNGHGKEVLRLRQEYNNSSEASLKLKTEFGSLERQSSIPGSRHRASCAETDLM